MVYDDKAQVGPGDDRVGFLQRQDALRILDLHAHAVGLQPAHALGDQPSADVVDRGSQNVISISTLDPLFVPEN